MSLALVVSACNSSSNKAASSPTTAGASASSPTSASGGGGGIPAGPIKVGMIEPLSGAIAPLGNDVLNATRTFIDQLNAAGGIDGHTLQLISENDQGDPATAVSEAEQLASDHIAVSFGASLGSSFDQVVPVFTKDKIIVINNEATDEYALDTSKYPYYFTVQPINKQDMEAMAAYAKAGGYKVGILTDGLPYGASLTSDFKAAAAAKGVDVVGTVDYSPTAVQLTTQVSQLKSEGATAVATLGETQQPQIYQAMKQIGFDVPVLGDAASALFPGAPPNAVGPCPDPLHAGAQPSAGKAAVAAAIKAAGLPETGQAANVIYRDEVQLYAQAVKAANSTSTDAVVAQLEKMTDVAPTTPGYKYTFSSSSHAGFVGVDGACAMATVGPDGYPVAAPTPGS